MTVFHYTLLCVICFLNTVQSKPPNIVFILADDLGFSDISPYGSEIHTPNIEELARNGMRFANYHTAASCAPSRGMINTGIDSHMNGCPNLAVALPPSLRDNDTYKGELLGPDRVLTVAERLRDVGYSTHLSGKWNLGKGKADAFYRGFQRSFSLADTGSDNYLFKSYLPIYPHPHYYEDGIPLDSLPEGFYSTEYIIDKAISYVEADRASGRPFFSYIGFQAVHIPVQVPRSYSLKYHGRYTEGWHVWREKRYNASIAAGVIPKTAVLKKPERIAEWNKLRADEREIFARAMEVYAGMIEALDEHIGRFMTYLKRIDEFENTVFIFTSDNGAEGTHPFAATSAASLLKGWLYLNDYTYDVSNLGEINSYNFIGPGWATVAASPLDEYKFNPGEGGLRVPLIFSGQPLGIDKKRRGSVTSAFTFATDIASTIVSLAGAKSSSPGGVAVMTGKDISGLLRGEASTVYAEDEPVGYELGGNAALFKGKYKIRVNRGVHGDAQWRMFDIENDPGETKELQHELPDLFEQLLNDYDAYALANGVKGYPDGYDQMKQLQWNTIYVYYTFRGSQEAVYVIPIQFAVLSGILFLALRPCFASRSKPKTD